MYRKLLSILMVVAMLFTATSVLAEESRPFADEIYENRATPENPEKVIFDTDMTQMHDDVKCMLMLLNSDVIDVLGVTTSPGNSHTEAGMAYTLRMLELFGYADVPVYPGAGVPLVHAFERYEYADGWEGIYGRPVPYGIFADEKPESYMELPEEPFIGYPETIEPQDKNAVEFIVETVKANPHEVTLVVVGACTNIALAIRTYPKIIPLVKQVIYMGGAINVPGNMTPVAEFNWWCDPEAAKICINAPFARQVLVPLDACNDAFVGKDFYDMMCAAPKTPFLEMYEALEIQYYQNDDDKSPVFDEITAAILTNPDIVLEMERLYVDVDITKGLSYGKAYGYTSWGILNETTGKPTNVPANTQEIEVVMKIDTEMLWQMMYEYLTK